MFLQRPQEGLRCATKPNLRQVIAVQENSPEQPARFKLETVQSSTASAYAASLEPGARALFATQGRSEFSPKDPNDFAVLCVATEVRLAEHEFAIKRHLKTSVTGGL